VCFIDVGEPDSAVSRGASNANDRPVLTHGASAGFEQSRLPSGGSSLHSRRRPGVGPSATLDLLFCPAIRPIPFQPRWSCLRCALTGKAGWGTRGRSALPRARRGQAAPRSWPSSQRSALAAYFIAWGSR